MGGLSHTVSGDIASFRTPSRVPIESLKFHFLPKQAAGTPSPENPIPIEGWTGLNGFRSRKNFLDTSTRAMADHYELNGITFDYNSDGSLTVNGKVSDSATTGPQYRLATWTQKVTGNYYICANAPYSGTYNEIYVYDSDLSERPKKWDGVTASQSASSGRPLSEVRLLAGHTYSFNVRINRGTDKTYNNDKFYPMLLPSWCTDTTFESYSGEQIPITFPSNGKNLFNKTDSAKIITGLNIEKGSLSYYHFTGSPRSTVVYIPCIPGKTYTVSKIATARSAVCYLKNNDVPTNGAEVFGYLNFNGLTSKTITVGNDATCLVVYITNLAYDNTPLQDVLDSLQIEYGDTVHIYEPYSSDNTFYGGYIDPVAGEIVATFKTINLKNKAWYYYTSNQFALTTDKKLLSEKVFCDMLPVSKINGYPTDDKSIGFWGNGQSYSNIIFIKYEASNDVNDFKTWLNSLESDPCLIYEFDTPIHIPIAAQDMKAFLDHNNFWSDANDITEVTYAVTESKDILATRKKAQSFNDYFQGELIFELNSDDPPVDGAWVDRISNMNYRLVGGASYDSVNKIYDFSGTGMAIYDAVWRDPFNLGHHFRIEWDIYFRRYGTTNGHFFDLGSLGRADSALGIGLLSKSASAITFNWKMLGNDSNPFGSSGELRTHPNIPVEGDTNYTHFVGFHEIIPWNDGYDRLRIKINNKIKRYETPIPKIEYTQWRTANSHFSVGSGVYNWDIDDNPVHYDAQYNCDVKIRSIKIYKYD